MVTIYPPARLIGEQTKKKGRKKERKKERKTSKTMANWLFAQTTHAIGSKSNFAWWDGLRCVVIHIKCHPNRVRGYGAVGSKIALSHYFGQWLIQQLVLPYKP